LADSPDAMIVTPVTFSPGRAKTIRDAVVLLKQRRDFGVLDRRGLPSRRKNLVNREHCGMANLDCYRVQEPFALIAKRRKTIEPDRAHERCERRARLGECAQDVEESRLLGRHGGQGSGAGEEGQGTQRRRPKALQVGVVEWPGT